MADYRLKKGYTLKMKGAPESSWGEALRPEKVAMKPTDFKGIKPKLSVKVGDRVKAGSSLFLHKEHPNFHFTSPVSGEVIEINRGERRALLEIVVKPDSSSESESFDQILKDDLLKASREKILSNLLRSGLFASFTQRPFGTVADPQTTPRDIFISAFLSGPLHPDVNYILEGNEDAFQAGLNALTRLTEGAVYLSYEGGHSDLSSALTGAQNVVTNAFSGKHPAGTVGVQIHHLKPMNAGDIVWTLTPSSVIQIGKLFLEGKRNSETVVAVAGESAGEKKHYKTIVGAQVSSIVQGKVQLTGPIRFISGDVLTGTKIEADGYLGFTDNLITIIPECEHKEFIGWLSPGFGKESFSKTFLSNFFPKKEYSHNTGYHGGVRAFVQTGQYESVVPMDIYPVHLIKSILYQDLEEMEALGILEVIEEDLALCDYICLSKIEVQKILREGLDLYEKES